MQEVAERAAKNLGVVIDIAVAVKCFGVSASYLTVVADSMVPVVGENHGFVSTRLFWILMATAAAAPPSFLRTMDSLRFTSLVALLCVAFLVILIIVFVTPALDPCSKTTAVGVGSSRCGGGIDVWPTAPISFLNKLSTFVFAYTCHQNIFLLTNELHKPTSGRIVAIVAASIGSAMAIYLVISFCGYFTFGNAVSSDILENYPHTVVVSVARVAISIVVVFSFPLQLHPARSSIKSLINFCADKCCATCCSRMCGAMPAQPDIEASKHDCPKPPDKESDCIERGTVCSDGRDTACSTASKVEVVAELSAHPQVACRYGPTFGGLCSTDTSMHYIITSIFIPASFGLAASGVDLGTLLSIVGAIGSTTISYIQPGFCYWRIRPKNAKICKVYTALFIFIAGCIIMPLALGVAIYNMIK